jgi:uncharacterized membrane protein YdfJ with MMPL/SSD domain
MDRADRFLWAHRRAVLASWATVVLAAMPLAMDQTDRLTAVTIAAVFATFAFTGVSTVQQTGVGNAVAILIDATLVRLVMVPASMQLLGDRNWWRPSWLRGLAAGRTAKRLGTQT